MTGWRDRTTKEQVVLLVVVFVGGFLLLSLTATVLFGLLGVDVGDIWRAIFDLVAMLVGAVVGWIAGTTIGARDGNGGHDA